MKFARLLLAVTVFAAIPSLLEAQVLDGLYVKEHTPTRNPIPYTSLREADVMWSHRIWRTIDLREKINHPLYYPNEPVNGRMSLFDVIKKGVNEGSLLAFDNTQDDFRVQLTKAQALETMSKIVTKQAEDPNNPGMYFEVIDTNNVESRDVIQYLIKEDWFFDRQRSVLDVRIIGIAPIIITRDADGAERGKTMLFWLYFPNCREVFANAETFNRTNDAERRTYEDIFWKRMFGSYITKQTNVYDRDIASYNTGLDALLEAEKIKNDIFTMEMDMWHY
ncbi:MAG: gliding motility protein GldN [Bacteroidetes bacterium]|nr:gliding motility protein GldN [Bacteroidota bacterium]HET6243242.1 gliding motility protein GldN [Bacteroidia bacterium]